MRSPEPTPQCPTSRSWLSAFRDGEAPQDEDARAHIDGCDACAAWSAALAGVEARVAALDRPGPDVAAAAVAAYDAQAAAAPRRRQEDLARLLLAVAGVAAVTLSALGLTDAFGTLSSAGAHVGRELYAFEAALGVGFLMAAWRPARYAASLLPITAVVIAVAVLPSAADLGSAQGSALREATHLPVLLGLGALLLHLDARRGARPTRSPRAA